MLNLAKPTFACAAALATVLSFGATVTPAFAKEPTAVVYGEREPLPTIRVSYSDLNLLSIHGQNTLNSRVGSAVRSLCPRSSVMPVADVARTNSCRDFAWSGARTQIASAIQGVQSGNGLTQAGASISIIARR